jgi:hypothetical protein
MGNRPAFPLPPSGSGRSRAGWSVSLLALLFALSTMVSGCSGAQRSSRPESGSRPADGRPSGRADEGDQRKASIYAAVIRRLVTKDHTFGGEPSPFERVFVIDGVVERAADPSAGADQIALKPFGAGTKERIARDLTDLPPLQFVTDPTSVTVNRKGCARVKGGGVLISLGPISKGTAETVTVANGLFFACLGGQWLTYVLKPVFGGWGVVGTTGPVAIS